MRKYLALLIFGLVTISGIAQKPHVTEYIDRYKEIAIAEMHRTGIPASIKLAQGILESDAGRSELAHNSRNHFGIKCGPIWEGGTFYKTDDDRDKRGRLIKSCFRVFGSPDMSFVAHSDFLMNPNKSYRYGWLFAIDKHDYKSWAWGLKESGYATNPKYGVLLIDIIERYELYSFDYYEPSKNMVVMNQPNAEPKPVINHEPLAPKRITASWKIRGTDHIKVIKGKVKNNGLSLVYAQKDDTPEKLADRYRIDVSDMIRHNEGIASHNQTLETAERVYLEPKKKKYKGAARAHTVLEGESMYEIAQIYGLRLDKLLKRNRLKASEEPIPGSHIYLRGRIKYRDRPALRMDNLAIEEVIPAIDDDSHTVLKGETLYSIARKYALTIDELKSRNDLQTSLIVPGQILHLDL